LDPTFFRCSSAKIQGWPKTPLAVPLCSETPINHGMWTDQGNKTGFVNWQPPKRYFWGSIKTILNFWNKCPSRLIVSTPLSEPARCVASASRSPWTFGFRNTNPALRDWVIDGFRWNDVGKLQPGFLDF
jgi:hypothetical protein